MPALDPAPALPVLAMLRAELDSLSPRMLHVANAVLADPERSTRELAGNLADRAGVSAATVSRFARRVGYASFGDLQKAMSRDLGRTAAATAGTTIAAGIRVDDDVATVVAKIAQDVQAVASDTRASLDPATLSTVADDLTRARRIVLFGIGASALVARDLQLKLERIGLNVTQAEDRHRGLTLASALIPGDVVVCFSHSGTTEDTVAVARVAAERGARVTAVSGRASSPLAGIADALLLGVAGAESTLRPAAMGSRISQLAIVDALFVIVAQRTYDETHALLARSWSAVHPTHEEQT